MASRAAPARPRSVVSATRTRLPDLELPDHTSRRRKLSELVGGDPLALFFSRGWWCPKEQRYLRGLVELQDEFFARVAPPPGPVVERHAGVAWPGGSFEASARLLIDPS
jgi:hypothetical protein